MPWARLQASLWGVSLAAFGAFGAGDEVLLNCAMTACQKGDRWVQAGLLGCWAAGLLGCWAGPRLEVVMIAHYLIFDWFFHFRLSHLSAIAAEICWEMPSWCFFPKDCPGIVESRSRMEQNGAERPRLCGSCVGSKVWSPSARWSQPRRGPTDSVSSMRCAVGASVQTPWPFRL